MNKKSVGGVKRRLKPLSAQPAADAIAPAAGDGWRKRRRITDGLIGLSSAIVLSVYAVGYVRTRETDEPIVTQNMSQSHLRCRQPLRYSLSVLRRKSPDQAGPLPPISAGGLRLWCDR